MGPTKHAVYTNPIQAAECIGGICFEPLCEGNEAFILLTSLPETLTRHLGVIICEKNPGVGNWASEE